MCLSVKLLKAVTIAFHSIDFIAVNKSQLHPSATTATVWSSFSFALNGFCCFIAVNKSQRHPLCYPQVVSGPCLLQSNQRQYSTSFVPNLYKQVVLMINMHTDDFMLCSNFLVNKSPDEVCCLLGICQTLLPCCKRYCSLHVRTHIFLAVNESLRHVCSYFSLKVLFLAAFDSRNIFVSLLSHFAVYCATCDWWSRKACYKSAVNIMFPALINRKSQLFQNPENIISHQWLLVTSFMYWSKKVKAKSGFAVVRNVCLCKHTWTWRYCHVHISIVVFFL